MTIVINAGQSVRIAGVIRTSADGNLTLAADLEADLATRGIATYVGSDPRVSPPNIDREWYRDEKIFEWNDAPVTNNGLVTGTAEARLVQFYLPPGTWKDFDRLEMKMSLDKSGATENFTMRVYLNTSGNFGTANEKIADGVILGGASTACGALLEFKRLAKQSIRRLGAGAIAAAYPGGSGTAFNPARDLTNGVNNGTTTPVIPDLDTTGVFITFTALSSAAVETLTLRDLKVRLSRF